MSASYYARSSIILLGDFSLFVYDTLLSFRRIWKRRGLFLRQCEFIGVTSFTVVAIAAVFMGAVLSYQLFMAYHRFGAEALLGGSVGVSLFKELGPVMTAIMVTGRAGAAMAAEIASMRVSEQIDALEIMAIDPIEYLVTPRVLAGVLMVPLLAVMFSIIATYSAYLVASGLMGMSGVIFWSHFTNVLDRIEVIHCVVKGAGFGLVLTWIGCFCGFRAQGGARSVGLATRSTVVATFLTILLFDYILTTLLPYGFSTLEAT